MILGPGSPNAGEDNAVGSPKAVKSKNNHNDGKERAVIGNPEQSPNDGEVPNDEEDPGSPNAELISELEQSPNVGDMVDPVHQSQNAEQISELEQSSDNVGDIVNPEHQSPNAGEGMEDNDDTKESIENNPDSSPLKSDTSIATSEHSHNQDTTADIEFF